MKKLTERQLEVAQLAADGLTNNEIGVELGISPSTAKAHIAMICTKMGGIRKREIGRTLKAQQA